MKDIQSYSIGEAAKKGIASVVKAAEADGLVVLKRNEQPVAIVMPITPIGYARYIEKISHVIDADITSKKVPDELLAMAYLIRGLHQMQRDMLGDNFKLPF